jgi:hypothetical protein
MCYCYVSALCCSPILVRFIQQIQEHAALEVAAEVGQAGEGSPQAPPLACKGVWVSQVRILCLMGVVVNLRIAVGTCTTATRGSLLINV